MTLKSKMSLLVSLTSISIISVGFSSWSITAESNAEIGGNIKVDNVSDSKEFIKLDTTKGDMIDPSKNLHSGIDKIDYCETSFLDNGGLINDTGTMINYYVINQEKCKNLFVGCNSLKVSLTIKYIDAITPTYNIFAENKNGSDVMSSFTHSVTCSKTPTSSTPYNIEKKQYTVDFTFNDLLKNYNSATELPNLSFAVKYSITAKRGQYFTDNIYSLLEMEDMQFTVVVALSAY